MHNKILIVSIFVTLMLLVPMTSAVDINTDVDDEARKNFEIEPLDDYEEIITLIIGHGDITTIKRLGLFLREVNVSTHVMCDRTIVLFGFRRSNGRLEIYFESFKKRIHVPRFRGFSIDHEIFGIAYGNIDY